MRGQPFEHAVTTAESFASLSPGAQKIVRLLSQLPSRLADPKIRAEVRAFLGACEEFGVNVVEVQQAWTVIAAYEGIVGGEDSESVRLVAS